MFRIFCIWCIIGNIIKYKTVGDINKPINKIKYYKITNNLHKIQYKIYK